MAVRRFNHDLPIGRDFSKKALDIIVLTRYNNSKIKFRRLEDMEIIKGAYQFDATYNNCDSYECGSTYDDECTGCNED